MWHDLRMDERRVAYVNGEPANLVPTLPKCRPGKPLARGEVHIVHPCLQCVAKKMACSFVAPLLVHERDSTCARCGRNGEPCMRRPGGGGFFVGDDICRPQLPDVKNKGES
jgi:hypothetical protein